MKTISVPLYIHPFDSYVPINATKLILGTMPPHRFCDESEKLEKDDVRFFYGSIDNSFWKIIEEVTGDSVAYENTENAVNERKSLLKKYNIAISDIIEEFTRCKESASDSSLCVYKLRDICSLLKENLNIITPPTKYNNLKTTK